MLSELCVRRPVFATMLVMSLVVLGIFSFRDLGVDLFPQSRSRDRQRHALAAGREPRRNLLVGGRADGSRRSAASPASTRSRRASARAAAASPSGSCSSATSTTRSNDVREKVAGAIRNVPPEMLPPVITKVDPDADPVMSLMVSSDAMSLRTLTEIADKQVSRAIQTVNGVGQVDHRRQPCPRNPHRRRHREAELLRPVDDAGARRRGRGERRDSRRRRRAGQGPAAAADARPRSTPPTTSTTSSSRPRTARRFACPTSATPKTRFERPTSSVWLGDNAGGAARHPPGDGREHRRGHRRRPRAAADDRARAAEVGQADRDPRRLEVHLRLGRLARGASDLRQPVRRDRRDVLHPQHPRGDHRVAGDSGVDHLVVHADAGDGVHAEQHDAARHHARRRHRHRRCDRRAREHLPLHRGEERVRRSKRRSRARARWRWR